MALAWLARWWHRDDTQRTAVFGALQLDSRKGTELVLDKLSAEGISVSDGRLPWAVGEPVRILIHATEGAEISIWAVVQRRSKDAVRLAFTPPLPKREVLATAAELLQATSIEITSEARGAL